MWRTNPRSGKLPFEEHGLRVEEASPSAVKLTIGERSTEAPRYWLARMLYRDTKNVRSDSVAGMSRTFGEAMQDPFIAQTLAR